MEETPKKEQSRGITVSDEIREALLSEHLIEGEDLRLPDYIKMKTELKTILAPVRIWSTEFDLWIDVHLNLMSSLGNNIESLGKWRENNVSNQKERKEKIDWYYSGAKLRLEQMSGWSTAFESWLINGSTSDLKRVGELMDYMGRVDVTITGARFGKDLKNEYKKRRIKNKSKYR